MIPPSRFRYDGIEYFLVIAKKDKHKKDKDSKELTPEEYHKEHGECPEGYHWSEKKQKCKETKDGKKDKKKRGDGDEGEGTEEKEEKEEKRPKPPKTKINVEDLEKLEKKQEKESEDKPEGSYDSNEEAKKLPKSIIFSPDDLDEDEKKHMHEHLKRFGAKSTLHAVNALTSWMKEPSKKNMDSVVAFAKKNRALLQSVMDLTVPEGLYRGIHVAPDHPLAKMQEGKSFNLESSGDASSWAGNQDVASDFASRGAEGRKCLTIKMESPKGVTALMAPPKRTKKWFEGVLSSVAEPKAFRYRKSEDEYLIDTKKVKSTIVSTKCRD